MENQTVPSTKPEPAPHEGILELVIEASARNKFLVFILTIFAIAGGVWGLLRTPLDAIPDLSDVQVIVYTDWEGRSPDLVEDQITYPISTRFIAARSRPGTTATAYQFPSNTSRTSSATAAGSPGTSASPPLITTPARRSPAGAPGVDNRSPGHRLSDSLRWSGTLNHSSGGMS